MTDIVKIGATDAVVCYNCILLSSVRRSACEILTLSHDIFPVYILNLRGFFFA